MLECSDGFSLGDDGVCRRCISECEAGGFVYGQCTPVASRECVMCDVTDDQCVSVALSGRLSRARSAASAAADASAAAALAVTLAPAAARIAREDADDAARVGRSAQLGGVMLPSAPLSLSMKYVSRTNRREAVTATWR